MESSNVSSLAVVATDEPVILLLGTFLEQFQ
jgi:hypothetical protein